MDTRLLREQFLSGEPYSHVVIDNFFDPVTAEKISNEFPKFDDPNVWTVFYDNPVEKKKACSHWDKFPPTIYSSLFWLCSAGFSEVIGEITGAKNVLADYGLNGGGLHTHSTNGKLNIHKDYSLHPKLPFKRNYNLIIYMTPNWQSEWGGGLELWSHDPERNRPKELVKTIENKFNRAVIFDTQQNSWHGLPQELNCPQGVTRNSLAVYYVTPVEANVEKRTRALFVPYKDQTNDPSIEEFCKKRSGEFA